MHLEKRLNPKQLIKLLWTAQAKLPFENVIVFLSHVAVQIHKLNIKICRNIKKIIWPDTTCYTILFLQHNCMKYPIVCGK